MFEINCPSTVELFRKNASIFRACKVMHSLYYCKIFCSGISALCHNGNHSLVQVHVYRAYTIILGLQFLYMPRCMQTRFNVFMQIIMQTSHVHTSTPNTSSIFLAHAVIHMCKIQNELCRVVAAHVLNQVLIELYGTYITVHFH